MIREFNNPELAPRNSFHVAQRAARLIEFDRTEDLQESSRKECLIRGTSSEEATTSSSRKTIPGTLLTPVATGYPHRGRTAGLRDGRSRRGRRVGRPGRMGRTARTVGIGKPLAHPRQSRAAPVQNIGAYGCEAKDAIRSVEMFCTETFNTLVLNREHCAFGYRDSVFKRSLRGRVIITSVRFALSRTPRPRLEYGDLAAASKRGEASRCATSARPSVRSAGPSCPTLR